MFPSILIILVIAALISNFSHLAWVQNAFAGIRVCVCILIVNAVISLWKKALVDIWTVLIFAAVFLCSVFLKISPVIYVIVAAVLGILLQLKKIRAASRKEEK